MSFYISKKKCCNLLQSVNIYRWWIWMRLKSQRYSTNNYITPHPYGKSTVIRIGLLSIWPVLQRSTIATMLAVMASYRKGKKFKSKLDQSRCTLSSVILPLLFFLEVTGKHMAMPYWYIRWNQGSMAKFFRDLISMSLHSTPALSLVFSQMLRCVHLTHSIQIFFSHWVWLKTIYTVISTF